MREFHFDPREDTPIVRAIIAGPKRSVKTRLIFDSGAAKTQIRDMTARILGFCEADRSTTVKLVGVEGEVVSGPLYSASLFFTLGKRMEEVSIAAFPMKHLEKEGIDGLLGWDVIRQLHLEMDGPAGILKVF